VRAEARDELTAEVVANAYCAFVRLARRGKLASAYATPLAQFAIRQVRDGRRVGCRQNAKDIMSCCARRIHGFKIERTVQKDLHTGTWNQLLVEDRRAGPAETAAARLDLAAWLRTLSKRNRQIAKALSFGETTDGVARQFGLSAGRVSQLRAWLREQWEQFQGGRKLASCVA
jgi:DNA-binding CsgD family transcriptional regulator